MLHLLKEKHISQFVKLELTITLLVSSNTHSNTEMVPTRSDNYKRGF